MTFFVRGFATVACALAAVPAAAHAEVWRSQGYGYVLVTSPGEVQVYDLAADRCSLSDTVPTLESLGAIERGDDDRFVLAGPTTRIAFERVATVPPACERTWPIDPDPLVNFDALWAIFNENYPSFAERGVDWQDIRAQFRPRVEALGPSGDPWPLFVEMLGRLQDPHVHLVDATRRFQARRGDVTPTATLQQALLAYLDGPESPLVGGATRLAHDRLVVGTTSGGIGYLAVMTMGGFSEGPVGWPGNTTAAADRAAALQALIAAFDRLQTTRAVILDLRLNPGGSEEIADLIAGCFADRRRLAYERKARDGTAYGPSFATHVAPNYCPRIDKPVVVLAGERTTSAAEALIMRLRVLPQVTIVGQATQGAHSDVLNKTLPNGWKLGLSNEVYTLADGEIYEGRGIPPTVATAAPGDGDTDAVRYGRDIQQAVSLLDEARQPAWWCDRSTCPMTPGAKLRLVTNG